MTEMPLARQLPRLCRRRCAVRRPRPGFPGLPDRQGPALDLLSPRFDITAKASPSRSSPPAGSTPHLLPRLFPRQARGLRDHLASGQKSGIAAPKNSAHVARLNFGHFVAGPTSLRHIRTIWSEIGGQGLEPARSLLAALPLAALALRQTHISQSFRPKFAPSATKFMQQAHGRPKLCCIAKRHVMLDIALTVVRDGLRKLLPALSSFQPFPSEMFGVFARCFKLIRPAPLGDAGPFFGLLQRLAAVMLGLVPS